MTGQWERAFEGAIEDRDVVLFRYPPTTHLKVATTQKGTVSMGAVADESSITMPFVISDGDPIEIEAPTADDLVLELQKCGFSECGAREIARHGRVPGA